jgi:hypothetical protein
MFEPSPKATKEIEAQSSAPVRKLYAKYFDDILEEHRKVCTDPKCDESTFAVSFKAPGAIVTPMVRVGSPKELFLTIHSEPFQAIQLATGDEIKHLFNENGSKLVGDCQCGELCTRESHPLNDTAFLHPKCHPFHTIAMIPLSNGRVSLICKTCGQPLLEPLQVAPRPKVKSPFIFCDNHGEQQGYMVCKHVVNGEEPEVLERATETEIGLASCRKCETLLHLSVEKFKKHEDKFGVVCAGHLNDRMNGKLEQRLEALEAVAA